MVPHPVTGLCNLGEVERRALLWGGEAARGGHPGGVVSARGAAPWLDAACVEEGPAVSQLMRTPASGCLCGSQGSSSESSNEASL